MSIRYINEMVTAVGIGLSPIEILRNHVESAADGGVFIQWLLPISG